jgi:hypothetical protein
VLPVKIDGGASTSVLRNKQLFQKRMELRFLHFQNPPFEERTDLRKSLTFLDLIFLVNRMDNPTSNLK